MMETSEGNDNWYTRNADGAITAFREVGADPALHSERNRLVQEYASLQLPEDYGLRVRYVDEIGCDPKDGQEFRGGSAFTNHQYNPGIVIEILIDKDAF